MTSIDELDSISNSLKAADLDGSEVTLKIKSYVIKEFDETSRDGETYKAKKPIFSFEGTDKTFVCNKTNRNAIAYAYGKEMDDWIGKDITLFPTIVPFGDKQVEAIRVRVLKANKAGKPKFLTDHENPAHGMDDLDDTIPF